MNRYAIFAAALTMAFVISAPVRAEEICELPSDIDEGKRYVIKFKGVKEKRFKIADVDDCWVQTFRTDGDHRWFPIRNIEYIGSKPIEK